MTVYLHYILRGRSLLRPLLIFPTVLLLIGGCTLPKEPGSLWWDIDVVVPFGVRTYGVWDLADPDSVLRADGSGIGMSEDSAAFFSMWTDVTASVADCVYFAPTQFEIYKPVNAIQVPVNYDGLTRFSLGTLNPDVAALHGTTSDVPEHTLTATEEIPLSELADTMKIYGAEATVLAINGLSYPIGNFHFHMPGSDGETTVVVGILLEAGQQESFTIPLTNAVTSSDLRFRYEITGLGGSQVPVDSTDQVTIAMQIDTLHAAPYTGRIPEQYLSGDTAVASGQQHSITLATIRSGTLSVRLTNATQVDDTLTLVLHDFLNQLNDSLTISRFVPAHGMDSVTLDLDEVRIRPLAGTPQTLRGALYMHSAETNDARNFESGVEYGRGEISISRLEFDYFSGELNHLLVPVDTSGISIERPPEGWTSVRPTVADAVLHVEESIGGTSNLDLDLATYLDGAQVNEKALMVDDVDMTPDSTTTVPGFESLLADYPDSVSITGTLDLNGEVIVFYNSEIQVAVEIQAPLMITFDDVQPPGTIEKIDTGDLDDIVSGSAEITIQNRLPVGGRAYLIASRDSLALLQNSGADVDTVLDISIPTPSIVDGRAVEIARIEDSVLLSDSVISWFRQPPFYARTQIEILGSGGDTLIVHGTDYLNVQILARLVYTIRTGEIE